MSKKNKQLTQPNSLEVAWTTFQRCHNDPRDPGAVIWKNSRYQIHIRLIPAIRGSAADLIHLSLRRIDRGTSIPFRDLMRIKRELLDPEIELVELYPAESRLIDTANQFHYWGINSPTFRIPFGFDQGRVVGDGNGDGAVQVPYEPGDIPADWLGREQLEQLLAQLPRDKTAASEGR